MGEEVIELKKSQIAGLITLGTAALGCGAYLWALTPGRSSEAQRAPFRGRYFAHRGLYTDTAPENSLAAFRAAAAAGYGVELDVRLTRDGIVVISHDDNLLRMTGRRVSVSSLSFDELQNLPLKGTAERVPRFSAALDILCSAKVPVIVELKTCRRWRKLCEKTLECLDQHDGIFCVESFDPRIVAWFRRKAPEMLRGFLTSQPNDLNLGPIKSFLSSRGLYNWMCRPQFIAHHVGKQSASIKLAQLLGAMRVTWTAHDRLEESHSDAVIFEHFLPPVHFR